MYLEGMGNIANAMSKRVVEGTCTSKAHPRLNYSKDKNQDDKMYISYKSLNQRIFDENVDHRHYEFDSRETHMRKKKLPIRNYRTKQNSPKNRVPSAGKIEITNYKPSKPHIQRPNSNLEINDYRDKPIFNHKHLIKRDQTLRDTNSHLDLIKNRHEMNLNSTISNKVSSVNSFVGRRRNGYETLSRQSPQPESITNDSKTPLKLLHYHKK